MTVKAQSRQFRIDFDLEGPQIRRDFKAVLHAEGTPCDMPPED